MSKCDSCKYRKQYYDGDTEAMYGECVTTNLYEVIECGRGYDKKYAAGGEDCTVFKEAEQLERNRNA